VIPWLLGVRGFYDFALGATLPPAYLVQTVLPLVLVAVAVYGAVKVRWAILVLPFVAVVVLQALAADRLGCATASSGRSSRSSPCSPQGSVSASSPSGGHAAPDCASGVVLMAVTAVLVARATIVVDTFRRDRRGEAWLQAPEPIAGERDEIKPTFWISATTPRPAYLRARLTGPPNCACKAPSARRCDLPREGGWISAFRSRVARRFGS